MNSHYQLISNENELRRFYQQHIKPFQADPQASRLGFKIILMVRRKYWPDLSIGQRMMDRRVFSVMKSEDQFIRDIQKYCIPTGAYVDSRNPDDSNTPIPQTGLALYITADPCQTLHAYFKAQKELSLKLEQMLAKPDEAHTIPFKPDSEYKTQVQKSALNIFKKLDVDTKDRLKLQALRELFLEQKIQPCLMTETRSGYHVLIHNKDGIQGEAHRALHDFCTQNKDWVTIEKKALLAIPGTYQGGFPVRQVDLDVWNQGPTDTNEEIEVVDKEVDDDHQYQKLPGLDMEVCFHCGDRRRFD